MNIHKEAIEKLKLNRAGTVQIKARREAAHSFKARGVANDSSSNLENFLSARALEAAGYLDSRLFARLTCLI